jgi:hypothetical protein
MGTKHGRETWGEKIIYDAYASWENNIKIALKEIASAFMD